MTEYTVDELARVADTMTTTVRMYQNKGLLAPPGKRGRLAIYDDSHLERIRLIGELQRRGHSLAGIADLLSGYERGAPLTDLLGLSALREPTPVSLPLIELADRLGGAALSPDDVVRAGAAGLVEFDGEQAIVTDVRFLDIGSALVELGVAPSIVLDEWLALSAVMEGVSERFATIFEKQLLPDMPDASLAELSATVDRLAALAREVTVTALERALRKDIQRFVEGSEETQ